MTISIGSLGLSEHIRRCVAGEDLTSDEMSEAVGLIMDGQASQAQVSALLVALRVKGETYDELVGAARAMRSRTVPVRSMRHPILDLCGTGGDGSGSFNVSTAAALVVAGAGVAVAKHGNRAMSGRCGSADVLEALGVNLNGAPGAAERALEHDGIAFLFAQAHHPAMRNVAAVRREIGIPTLFNLLGPLMNPAPVTHQVIGVAQERAQQLIAQALPRLGCERAAVVCAEDGMDEVSISCPTRVVEWSGSGFMSYVMVPEMFGVQRRPVTAIAGGNAQDNAEIVERVLAGKPGPHRDVVLLNAALALHVAGAGDPLTTFGLAQTSIDCGAARRALQALVEAR